MVTTLAAMRWKSLISSAGIILLLLTRGSLLAEGQGLAVEWERILDPPVALRCFESDGASGFLLGGWTSSFRVNGTEFDAFYARADASGKLLWSHDVDFAGVDEMLGAAPLPGGGFVFVGATEGIDTCAVGCGFGPGNLHVLKVDADGETIWSRVYRREGSEWGRSVIACRNGDIVVTGTVTSGTTCDLRIWRIDPGGELIWERSFGGAGSQLGFDVIEMASENLVVVGASRRTDDEQTSGALVISVDSKGDLLWEKVIAQPGGWARSVVVTGDKAIVLAGSRRLDPVHTEVLVAKLRENGQLEWEWTFPSLDAERPRSVAMKLEKGAKFGYVVLARASFQFDRTFLLRLGEEGQVLWRSYLADWIVGAWGAIPSGDDAYVVGGDAPLFLTKLRFRGMRRGDANDDRRVNIADAVRILHLLFAGASELSCQDAGDVDDNGAIEVTDAIRILAFLFLAGPPPGSPARFPCSPDTTEDDLSCETVSAGCS